MDADSTRNARREARVGWARGHRLVLTPRDLQLLFAVGVMRVARTSDLTALFFGSVEPARDRLRRLFVAGYLACHAPLVNGENHYTLTERGRDSVLAEHDDLDPALVVCVRALPARLEHLALVNRARVLFTVATRPADAPYRLASFRSEWQLVREGSAAIYGILPDAIVQLERPDGSTVDVAIEADTGSESPTVVASKARRYMHYVRSGQLLFGANVRRIVVLAVGARRCRALARAVAAVEPTAPMLLGDVRSLGPAAIFAGGLVTLDELVQPPAAPP